ncbi:MAG: hypothetical protein WC627_02705 [Legionella sp.]
MVIKFFFDVEAEDLHKDGISFGYCVIEIDDTTNAVPKIIDQGDCHSIEGAQKSCAWVTENVLPQLSAIRPYLNLPFNTINASNLPANVVKTKQELRERFFKLYKKHTNLSKNVEFWVDVGFPVETFFLKQIVEDGRGSRDLSMPYPLMDLSSLLDFSISRKAFCGVNGLMEHNPLHDALAIFYSLQRYKQNTNNIPPFILNHLSKPKLVFDVGAKDLQLGAFGFGYIVTCFDGQNMQILEVGQCYSIKSAQKVREYVATKSLPNVTILQPWLKKDCDSISKSDLPFELVISANELRDRFFAIYTRWKELGAGIYAGDVTYPVEANFLSKVVQDDLAMRSFKMPYPLYDIVNILHSNISRNNFSGLDFIQKGNPLHHAITSSCSLYLTAIMTDTNFAMKEQTLIAIRQAYQKYIIPFNPNHSKLFDGKINTVSHLDTSTTNPNKCVNFLKQLFFCSKQEQITPIKNHASINPSI